MSSKKKEIRNRFRLAVFKRDGNRCKVCGANRRLDAHHIIDRNEFAHGGYVEENGISLCSDCHEKAEKWHSSGHSEFVAGYHPDDLYKLIGSNMVLATDADLHMEEK